VLFRFLWLAWAALLALAMILGNQSGGHGAAAATWARMGSSLALVATGWAALLWRRTDAGRRCNRHRRRGTIGDFNASLLKFVLAKNPVLGGVAFGSHIATSRAASTGPAAQYARPYLPGAMDGNCGVATGQ
jgi:hypothetical protein